ncbi:MAG TPA: chemotaxis protein CheA [Candidatus Ozemobacteraceae bacterium]|nr:chemotaxis protein CheA [Candidatus Ozemobacteraceae bacterium]
MSNMEEILLDVILTTGISESEIREKLAPFLDGNRLAIEAISKPPSAIEDKVPLLGELLVADGALSSEELGKALKDQKPIGERLVDAGMVTREKVEAALSEQVRKREQIEKRAKSDGASSIRVSSFKLDKLVNLVGELVTVQERLTQISGLIRKTKPNQLPTLLHKYDIGRVAEEVSRLTNGLRDNALSIRMLPIEATFSKFKRLVHDLSASLSKDIELTMSGEETEIDKTVIDRLDEPLMHLIRNSADHGIELPDDRILAGKSPRGTIHLAAEHLGGNVVIHIEDDGAGLNREAIVKKAVEKHLIAPGAELSEREVFQLIFLPGFSTSAAVTSISGRGVGMDVVKKAIDDLRGTIDVTSTSGKGMRVDITLPLTLAIIDGLLVNIGNQAFIIPVTVVEECIVLKASERKEHGHRKLAPLRGTLVPYLELRNRFGIQGKRPDIEQIVIARIRGERIGLVVDSVVGEHKTVIKPLGKVYRNITECSGATVLGDGSIALIIDTGRLIGKNAEHTH